MAVGVERPRANVNVKAGRTWRRGLRKSQLLTLVLALVGGIAAGYIGYQRLTTGAAPVAPPTTTPVRRDTITATINVAGSTAATSLAKLSFDSAGRVAEVLVKAGDSVKAGDVLARLGSADLEIQVAQAEVSLEQDKLKLAQLKEGPKEVEVAAAQASYVSAATKFNDLKSAPKPEDVAAAQAAIRDAEVALANARDSLVLTQKSATVSKNVRDRENEHAWYEARYGDTLARFNSGQANQSDLDQDWSNLLTAKERLDSARAEAEMATRKAENDVKKAEDALRASQDKLQLLLAGSTVDQLQAAEAAMLTAQSQLESKRSGAAAAEIAAQEVAVRLAEATLKQRQIALDKATLLAPFDGIIDAVSVSVGEQASASTEVMTLVNMRQFRVDARVDETDVTNLKVGQTAAVTLDALPNEQLRARVEFIAASAVVQQGVVNYPIVLALEPTQAPVRPGMSASASVEVARRENVLLVPNRAVRSQGRGRAVEVLRDGASEMRSVTTGMSNDQFTEITGGLQDGDVVIIPATTTAAPRIPQSPGLGIPGIGGR